MPIDVGKFKKSMAAFADIDPETPLWFITEGFYGFKHTMDPSPGSEVLIGWIDENGRFAPQCLLHRYTLGGLIEMLDKIPHDSTLEPRGGVLQNVGGFAFYFKPHTCVEPHVWVVDNYPSYIGMYNGTTQLSKRVQIPVVAGE